MEKGFILSSIDHVLSWARSNSLWTFTTGEGCCANEVFQTFGCRYDLERLGCLPQESAQHADLLIVSGLVTLKLAPELKKVYQSMAFPKYVMAVGACACHGGIYGRSWNYSVLQGCADAIPVDVFVPGCPPRPEAIMNGLIVLKEKIKGEGKARDLSTEIV